MYYVLLTICQPTISILWNSCMAYFNSNFILKTVSNSKPFFKLFHIVDYLRVIKAYCYDCYQISENIRYFDYYWCVSVMKLCVYSRANILYKYKRTHICLYLKFSFYPCMYICMLYNVYSVYNHVMYWEQKLQ